MYVTLAEFREFAASTGKELPLNDDEAMILLNKATIYIDSVDDRLIGVRATRDQLHAYPRRDLVLNGWVYEDDEIPNLVKQCQMAFAIEVNDGIDIFNYKAELPVVSESVDSISVSYAHPQNVKAEERESLAMSLLRQLMGGKKIIGFLEIVRT